MKRLMLALLLAALLLCACGGTAAPQTTGTPAPEPTETPDLAALCEALRALFPEMMEVDSAMLLDFLGIRDEDCAQCVALLAADGTKADELWLLEAVDDAAVLRLEKLAVDRMNAKMEETETYAPAQHEIVIRGEVRVLGRFVVLVVTDRSEEAGELIEKTLN